MARLTAALLNQAFRHPGPELPDNGREFFGIRGFFW